MLKFCVFKKNVYICNTEINDKNLQLWKKNQQIERD